MKLFNHSRPLCVNHAPLFLFNNAPIKIIHLHRLDHHYHRGLPKQQIPHFRDENLTLTNFNISSNSIIYRTWDTHFVAQNPNSELRIFYDVIKANLFYKLEEVCVTPFE